MVRRVLAGRYELVRFVGRGGMGEVWEGRDRVIDRRVAVKLVHDVRDTSGAALFLREARVAGGLNHPGVVTVYDLGQDPDEGTLFLVMEFVTGRNLATVLFEDGPPPVATAVDWAARAATALAAAHGAGVAHRDLKPANLMLTAAGGVKVLDFGIARYLEGTHRSSKVMGTLAYMPPERFDEQPGDARSDLYSFGCVLHELLTGTTPFEATGPVSMMNAHLRRAPKLPGTTRDGIPADLDDLVLALLAKDPVHRPTSAAEVGERLARIDVRGASMPGTSSKSTGAGTPSPARASGANADEDSDRRIPAAPTTQVRRPRETLARQADAETSTANSNRPGLPEAPAVSGTGDGASSGASSGGGSSRRRFLWLGAVGAAATGVGIVASLIGDGDSDPQTPRNPKTWRYKTEGLVLSSPVVADGVLYVGSADTNVYALDAATGSKRWSATVDGPVASSPTVVDGVVYVGNKLGLFALDAATGARRWSYPHTPLGFRTPAVAAGVVYVGSPDHSVYAVDAATGEGPE